MNTDRRIASQQVAALFRLLPLGVTGAASAAVLLALLLVRADAVDPFSAWCWAAFIVLCAMAHLALFFFWRRRETTRPPQSWAVIFAIISLAEGVGWGWATAFLVSNGRYDLEVTVFAVGLGVSAGAVAAFSPYLPAFAGLFLPTVAPFVITHIAAGDAQRQGAALLALVFGVVVGGLGVSANRTFREGLSLRLAAEDMAEDLQRQKDIAEAANRAKSSFLAAASHDLRQPVHAIGLLVGALTRLDMPAEAQRLIERIEKSASAMDDLFSAILDISRLDAGVVEVHRSIVAIDRVIERICMDHTQEAQAKGLRLTACSSGLLADCDPILVERIVRNLLSNAVRHTARGRVLVGCRRRGRHVAIQVVDTGPGIDPDKQDLIFQEYYQIGNPERERANGLGLGLAIVRRLTDLIDCPLRLVSHPGRGSCFELLVPLAENEPDQEDEEMEAVDAQGWIVVVEDDLNIRDAMKSLLQGWGYKVTVAASSAEAVRAVADLPWRPDLLIADFRLRGEETGIDAIDRLRGEYNHTIPAMLVTGDTAPDRLAEAKTSGLLLLHKPVSNARLRAAIVNLMRSDRS